MQTDLFHSYIFLVLLNALFLWKFTSDFHNHHGTDTSSKTMAVLPLSEAKSGVLLNFFILLELRYFALFEWNKKMLRPTEIKQRQFSKTLCKTREVITFCWDDLAVLRVISKEMKFVVLKVAEIELYRSCELLYKIPRSYKFWLFSICPSHRINWKACF